MHCRQLLCARSSGPGLCYSEGPEPHPISARTEVFDRVAVLETSQAEFGGSPVGKRPKHLLFGAERFVSNSFTMILRKIGNTTVSWTWALCLNP